MIIIASHPGPSHKALWEGPGYEANDHYGSEAGHRECVCLGVRTHTVNTFVAIWSESAHSDWVEPLCPYNHYVVSMVVLCTSYVNNTHR